MINIETVSQVWPLVLTFVFVVSWCIRLESKVKYIADEGKESKREATKKDEAIWKKLDSFQDSMNKVLVSLAKIEGKLEGHDK